MGVRLVEGDMQAILSATSMVDHENPYPPCWCIDRTHGLQSFGDMGYLSPRSIQLGERLGEGGHWIMEDQSEFHLNQTNNTA